VVPGENQVGVMSIETSGASALEYLPCRYGNSKLLFRGPRRRLRNPYVAFLGGTETYGKFVPQPFSAIVESRLGMDCVNLGCLNAGLDTFVNDGEVQGIATGAELSVLQVLGAQNLSNRFFRVHPRRNDRFLQASPLLSAIYREVDFTEFNFNKHMLGHLQMLSSDRFQTVRDELRQAWSGRMRLLLDSIGSATILLWVHMAASDKAPMSAEPMLVTADMIESLGDRVLDVVDVAIEPAGRAGDMGDMVYGQMDAPAAMQLPGPRAHEQIADAMTLALRRAL
jgi:uncharacterized protein DUF6473